MYIFNCAEGDLNSRYTRYEQDALPIKLSANKRTGEDLNLRMLTHNSLANYRLRPLGHLLNLYVFDPTTPSGTITLLRLSNHYQS